MHRPGMTRRGMGRRSLLLALAGAGVTAASLSPTRTRATPAASRNLVAYLSRTGNTRVIAGQLSRTYRADLFEIRTAEPYPEDYEATVELAQRQRDAAATPPLAAHVGDMAAYDTVFLGFPIWGMALPAPVRTFLATHDLSGKTLAPFVTHGGYGTGSALATVSELAPASQVVEPFVLQADQERETLKRVATWLRGIDNAL